MSGIRCVDAKRMADQEAGWMNRYEKSNSLVGIFRDQEVNSSRSLTLDLQQVRLQPHQDVDNVDAFIAPGG